MRTRPSTAAPLAFLVLLAFALLSAPFARPVSAADDAAPAETTSAGFAPAAGAAAFGGAGQLALSLGATADEHFFFHKTSGAWQLRIAPAADYFVLQSFSVGGVVAYEHDSGGGGTGTNGLGRDSFSIGARAGYAFAFNDRFGVWPLLGVRLDYTSANHASQTDTWLPIYLPFLFHPAPHFFAGVGPNFQVHLSGHETTVWGIDTVLGGWFSP
jgi:hypothetical protein